MRNGAPIWPGPAPCPMCKRSERHIHFGIRTPVADIEYRTLEALGFCPDSGMPFQMCIVGPCDCLLPLEAVPCYIAKIQEDLAKIKEALE